MSSYNMTPTPSAGAINNDTVMANVEINDEYFTVDSAIYNRSATANKQHQDDPSEDDLFGSGDEGDQISPVSASSTSTGVSRSPGSPGSPVQNKTRRVGGIQSPRHETKAAPTVAPAPQLTLPKIPAMPTMPKAPAAAGNAFDMRYMPAGNVEPAEAPVAQAPVQPAVTKKTRKASKVSTVANQPEFTARSHAHLYEPAPNANDKPWNQTSSAIQQALRGPTFSCRRPSVSVEPVAASQPTFFQPAAASQPTFVQPAVTQPTFSQQTVPAQQTVTAQPQTETAPKKEKRAYRKRTTPAAPRSRKASTPAPVVSQPATTTGPTAFAPHPVFANQPMAQPYQQQQEFFRPAVHFSGINYANSARQATPAVYGLTTAPAPSYTMPPTTAPAPGFNMAVQQQQNAYTASDPFTNAAPAPGYNMVQQQNGFTLTAPSAANSFQAGAAAPATPTKRGRKRSADPAGPPAAKRARGGSRVQTLRAEAVQTAPPQAGGFGTPPQAGPGTPPAPARDQIPPGTPQDPRLGHSDQAAIEDAVQKGVLEAALMVMQEGITEGRIFAQPLLEGPDAILEDAVRSRELMLQIKQLVIRTGPPNARKAYLDATRRYFELIFTEQRELGTALGHELMSGPLTDSDDRKDARKDIAVKYQAIVKKWPDVALLNSSAVLPTSVTQDNGMVHNNVAHGFTFPALGGGGTFAQAHASAQAQMAFQHAAPMQQQVVSAPLAPAQPQSQGNVPSQAAMSQQNQGLFSSNNQPQPQSNLLSQVPMPQQSHGSIPSNAQASAPVSPSQNSAHQQDHSAPLSLPNAEESALDASPEIQNTQTDTSQQQEVAPSSDDVQPQAAPSVDNDQPQAAPSFDDVQPMGMALLTQPAVVQQPQPQMGDQMDVDMPVGPATTFVLNGLAGYLTGNGIEEKDGLSLFGFPHPTLTEVKTSNDPRPAQQLGGPKPQGVVYDFAMGSFCIWMKMPTGPTLIVMPKGCERQEKHLVLFNDLVEKCGLVVPKNFILPMGDNLSESLKFLVSAVNAGDVFEEQHALRYNIDIALQYAKGNQQPALARYEARQVANQQAALQHAQQQQAEQFQPAQPQYQVEQGYPDARQYQMNQQPGVDQEQSDADHQFGGEQQQLDGEYLRAAQ